MGRGRTDDARCGHGTAPAPDNDLKVEEREREKESIAAESTEKRRK